MYVCMCVCIFGHKKLHISGHINKCQLYNIDDQIFSTLMHAINFFLILAMLLLVISFLFKIVDLFKL